MNAGKLIAAVLAALTLAGCAQEHDSEGRNQPELVWPNVVDLPDGRHVLCVFEKEGYGGGPSCDWTNAK